MPDMTLAERVERTRAIHAELAELWADQTASVFLHNRSHQELHDSGYAPMGRPLPNPNGGGYFFSVPLGKYTRAPMLYAEVDPTCRQCHELMWPAQELPTESRPAEAVPV